jgi:cation diffusion facilitator family transporter
VTDRIGSDNQKKKLRATLLGIIGNVLLVGIKLTAGVLGNSYALIADAAESALDIGGSLVVYGSLNVSALPPDENHPYGHGRAEALAALFISLALMLVAVGLTIASVREILTPHHCPAWYTLLVLGVVIAIKEGLFRVVVSVGKKTGSTAVEADAWHHRSDSITSAAAFIGIALALIMGKGWESADDWAALLACGIIGWNGLNICRPAIAEIMDAAPDPKVEQAVRALAGAVPGVVSLDKCFIRKYGYHFLVDIHVRVDGALTVHRGHEIAHAVKRALRDSDLKIHDVLVHIEPS